MIPLEIDPTTANNIGDGVSVTLFDANHCPGSAMFLFRRKGESLLYTGDFRYDPKMRLPDDIRINTLHIDSTFCNCKYAFPLQEDVEDMIVDKIRTMGDKNLFVIGAYKVGKERIVIHIIDKLKKNVYLSPDKYNNYKLIGFPDSVMSHITTNPNATNIHVDDMQNAYVNKLREKYDAYTSKYDTIVGFTPTGWVLDECYKVSKDGTTTILPYTVRGGGKFVTFGFPYSEHCSYNELLAFVKRINPERIIPFDFKNSDSETVVRALKGEIPNFSPKPPPKTPKGGSGRGSLTQSGSKLVSPPSSEKKDKTKTITDFFSSNLPIKKSTPQNSNGKSHITSSLCTPLKESSFRRAQSEVMNVDVQGKSVDKAKETHTKKVSSEEKNGKGMMRDKEKEKVKSDNNSNKDTVIIDDDDDEAKK